MKSINRIRLFVVLILLILSACGTKTEESPPPPIEKPVINQEAGSDTKDETPEIPAEADPDPEIESTTLIAEGAKSADIIFRNGNLITMAQEQPTATAIALRDDIILAVGSDQDVLAHASEETIIVDLEGKTMFPGFIESHSHRITQRSKWNYSIEEATLNAARQGWTTLDELYVQQWEFDEMIAAEKAGDLLVRVNAFLSVNGFAGETFDDWYHAYDPGEQFGENLRAAAL